MIRRVTSRGVYLTDIIGTTPRNDKNQSYDEESNRFHVEGDSIDISILRIDHL
jgi:hypothetical protein